MTHLELKGYEMILSPIKELLRGHKPEGAKKKKKSYNHQDVLAVLFENNH